MLNISYEEALQNFPHLLDDVTTNHHVITVQGANHQSVVMMCKDDFESINTTLPHPIAADTTIAVANNNLDGWL